MLHCGSLAVRIIRVRSVFCHYTGPAEQNFAPTGAAAYHQFWTYCYVQKCVCVFFYICTLFSGVRGFFLALSAAGHAWGPAVHHGASLGPGRAPWRVVWAFKVAKSCKQSRGVLSVELEPSKTMENPHVSFCALTSHARTTPGFKLSSFLQQRTLLACVDIAYA